MFNRRMLSLLVALSAAGAVQAQDQTTETADPVPEDDVMLEEVYVQGVRNAELNARQEERNKEAFSSVIAQDDAGDFADQNVAESLQRLPGITLQKTEGEGKKINLRGLGPQFVNVTMNGSELASASDDREFSLDTISADMLGGIEVNKTILPSMDTYGTAGSVNLKTVSAFDKKRDSLKLKAQVNRQSYKGDLNPKVSISGTNLFADDSIGLGYTLSAEKRSTVNYEGIQHQSSAPQILTAGESSDHTITPYQFQLREENAERTRYSGSFDLGWRPTDNSEVTLRYSHTEYEDLDVALREYYRWDPATEGKNEIAFVNRELRTFGVVDAELQHQYFIQKAKDTNDTVALEGEFVFADEWTFDFNLAHSKATNKKPDGRRVQYRLRDIPMIGVWGEDYTRGYVVSKEEIEQWATNTSLTTSGTGNISAYSFGDTYQPAMEFDNLLLENTDQDETLSSLEVNLQKDFSESMLEYVKVGLKVKDREKQRDKNRWSLNPQSEADLCAKFSGDTKELDSSAESECDTVARYSTYASVDTYMPSHPDAQYQMITEESAEAVIAATRGIANYYKGADSLESQADDYSLDESSSSAYIQAKFLLSDVSHIITGVRYSSTEMDSTGNFTISFDRFDDGGEIYDISLPMTQDGSKTYTDIHPSIHFVYEPSDEWMYRAALWTSGTRPTFNQSRVYGKFGSRIVLDNDVYGWKNVDDPSDGAYNTAHPDYPDPDTPDQSLAQFLAQDGWHVASNNTFQIGNPSLDPMYSINFDASATWVPSEDLYLQAAFFYKDIKDFIVEVRGMPSTFEDLPVSIPTDQVTAFEFRPNTIYDNVNMFINGNTATVTGLELMGSYYLDKGFFLIGNATLIDSEADPGESVRTEKVKMPDMAAVTMNLTVGWENEVASARLIGNYRSKVLDTLGACSQPDIDKDTQENNGVPYNCGDWQDIYLASSYSIDFKATYKLTDDIKLFMDATNITGEVDTSYFEGNEYSNGHMLYHREDFGPSVQLGVNWTFY